jgi:formate-dependent nitrite reductase membrane component NrfD
VSDPVRARGEARHGQDRRRRWHGEPRSSLSPAPAAGAEQPGGWEGPTYYGRQQLKSAPFNNWIVGGYIFLAGLSGSASLIGTIADAAGGPQAEDVGRRARLLGFLAPSIGSLLLIQDLHTPQRFYNMLRIFKPRSPMSIGTWILMAFSAGAVPAAMAEFLSRFPGLRWLRRAAQVAQVPAAAAGAGLSVYTASLLSATSTPAWAAVPRPLAVRFGASSVASGAAALALGEQDPDVRRTLQMLAAGALGVEAVATRAQTAAYQDRGVEAGTQDRWGKVEKYVATGLGLMAPLALFGAALALGGRRGRALGEAAAVATLAGSALLRVSTLGMGNESALRPEVSIAFAQRRNLDRPGAGGDRRTGDASPLPGNDGVQVARRRRPW